MNTYPYVLQRIMQSFWKIRLSVTEKSNRKQNRINVRLYNYSITTCSQSLTMTMLKSDVQSVRLFRGYSTAVRWCPATRPTAAVQPFCEHGKPGHRLVETWRKVQILNEWLAKDVAAIACSGNTNHLSSQPINKNQELGMPKRWNSNGHHYWKNVECLRRKRSVHTGNK